VTKYIDTNNAAKAVGISVRTLRDYARNNMVSCLQVGNAWRFDLKKLEEQLSEIADSNLSQEATVTKKTKGFTQKNPYVSDNDAKEKLSKIL